MDRASLDKTTNAANTPSVTIAVMSGKRQKSQSIVPADTVSMARKATVPIRAEDDVLILTPRATRTLRCK
jgi:hypothetical protein